MLHGFFASFSNLEKPKSAEDTSTSNRTFTIEFRLAENSLFGRFVALFVAPLRLEASFALANAPLLPTNPVLARLAGTSG